MSNINLESMNVIIYLIKTFFISSATYYFSLKVVEENKVSVYKNIWVYFLLLIITIICTLIKYGSNSSNSIIFLGLCLSIIFSKVLKKDISYSIIVITFSLSINYIFLFISSIISFCISIVMNIRAESISLIFIIIPHIILMFLFLRKKRFKKGLQFLKEKTENEYLNILILNTSTIIIFAAIIIVNYNGEFTMKLISGFVIFSIIMFITIQKSLQLYYKQKLIIQDLDETKKELEDKNKEIKELEKENLNLSKINHSVAHKQKSLEYKLNQLILKNEIAEELDIKDKMNNISRELDNQKTVELTKTNISEIDDMLKYMQSECIKNNIDFELQISENINHMINKVIPKENLEILIADHIKNSIIAIKHSKNSNKSILVRIGLIDGIYSIYVYDSGIEFEIKTLKNLGIKPSSTHLNDGGSGMGFMNTFDTLNKFNASIIINEYGKESKDNYTKYIAIKFDSRHEFKIYSYRADKIKEKNNNKNIIIESQDLKW